VGPLVNPGVYTIELLVEGKSYTSKLQVKLDPRERIEGGEKEKGGSPATARRGKLEPGELEQQLRLAIQIRKDITLLTRTAEQLRSVRKQLQDRDKLLADDDK